MYDEVLKFKVKNCLTCGAETEPGDGEEMFCSKCGAPVVNKCSSYECDKILNEKAKFCKFCGSPSIFKNYGLLDKPAPSNSDEDELPF